MIVTNCDVCKKAILDDAGFTAGKGYKRFHLCAKCGAPVEKILKKYKLGV